MAYDATTTKIFEIQPYFFFYVIGIVFSSSLFIILLRKFNYNVPRYTKIFFFSITGLLAGAKLFGFLTGLYRALAEKENITISTFLNTGIVFYGGLIGFILTFLLICKVWNKKIEYGVVDISAVCIPLFHFWGRFSCFFSGCCYGKESHSTFSVLYTNHVDHEIMTVSRIPVQLIEAGLNLMIFFVLIILLLKQKFKERLLIVYLLIYAIMRIILELFRGDLARGIWNGISFSQFVSLIIIFTSMLFFISGMHKKEREYAIF